METSPRNTLLAVLLVLLAVPPALAQQISVRDIAQNPTRYDGASVTVWGTVTAYRERVSAHGNPYTTFRVEGAARQTRPRRPLRPTPTPSPTSTLSGGRFNVRDFGARGDGVTDDTDAIQATINAAPNGTADVRSVIYFPAGTYRVSSRRDVGFLVRNRSGLQFEGEGSSSIVKRDPSFPYSRVATFENASNIGISNLTFDANGIIRYGGVNFFSVRRVRIENTRFIDSRPQGLTGADHYAYVFGHGATPSEDIEILNNHIETLQVEVDHSRRVRIEGNTSVAVASSAAISVYAVGDDAVAEDYLIARNTVSDTLHWNAFVAVIDHYTYRRTTFRRIRFIENRVVRRTPAGPSFSIGASDASQQQDGHIFEDITLEGNIVEHDPSFSFREPAPVIAFQSAEAAGFDFQRVIVRNNRILGNGRETYWVMDARQLQNSIVEGNVIRGGRNGIAVFSNILNTKVRGNTVQVSDTAYYFGESNPAGGNAFQGNRYVGTPTRPLMTANLAASDVVEQPIQVPSLGSRTSLLGRVLHVLGWLWK